MNGLFALCHFCEQHGPRILSCTQAFHDEPDVSEALLSSTPVGEKLPTWLGRLTPARDTKASSVDFQSAVSSIEESPAPSPLRPVATSPRTEAAPVNCSGCCWEGDSPGYFSTDEESHTLYASSFRPMPDLYAALRQACLRSLSCEVCPGREGPMMFGDPTNGYVFSYAFFLQDHQARGSQRWYSVVFLMQDHVHLISCWQYLVTHLQRFVTDLQARVSGPRRSPLTGICQATEHDAEHRRSSSALAHRLLGALSVKLTRLV